MVNRMSKFNQLFLTAWVLIGTCLSLAGPGQDSVIYYTIVITGLFFSILLQDSINLFKQAVTAMIDESIERGNQ